MAELITAAGARSACYPRSRSFTLQEMYSYLQCETVQMIDLADGRVMVVDEDGKARGKERNATADLLAVEAGDFIVGDVLVCSRREAGYEEPMGDDPTVGDDEDGMAETDDAASEIEELELEPEEVDDPSAGGDEP